MILKSHKDQQHKLISILNLYNQSAIVSDCSHINKK
jgi:hypothetical protein